MASIRMTSNLRSSIIYNAKELYASSILKAEKQLSTSFTERLVTELKSFHFTKYDLSYLPSEWFITCKGISGNIKGIIEDQKYHYSYVESIDSFLILNIQTFISNNKYFIFNDFTPSNSLFTEYHTYKQRIKKVVNEKINFINEINKLVNRCNTLKQFLDAWPQGENLIDASLVITLNKAPIKKEKAELLTSDLQKELSSKLIKRTILK